MFLDWFVSEEYGNFLYFTVTGLIISSMVKVAYDSIWVARLKREEREEREERKERGEKRLKKLLYSSEYLKQALFNENFNIAEYKAEVFQFVREKYFITDVHLRRATFDRIFRWQEQLGCSLGIPYDKIEVFRTLLRVFDLREIIRKCSNGQSNYDALTCMLLETHASDVLSLLWTDELYIKFVAEKLSYFLDAALKYKDVYALKKAVDLYVEQDEDCVNNLAARAVLAYDNLQVLRILLNIPGVREAVSTMDFEVNNLFRDNHYYVREAWHPLGNTGYYASMGLLLNLITNEKRVEDILENFANMPDVMVMCFEHKAFRKSKNRYVLVEETRTDRLSVSIRQLFTDWATSDLSGKSAWGIMNSKILRDFLKKDTVHCMRFMKQILDYPVLNTLREKFKDILFNGHLAAGRGLVPVLPKEVWEHIGWFMWNLEGDSQVTNGFEARVITMHQSLTVKSLTTVMGLTPDEDAISLPALNGPHNDAYDEACEEIEGTIERYVASIV